MKKMLEVLVAQYPLSDVWALPGVRAGGNELAQKGLERWGPADGWMCCRKGGNTEECHSLVQGGTSAPSTCRAGQMVVLLHTPIFPDLL